MQESFIRKTSLLYCLFLTFFCGASTLYGQTIEGIVLDKKNEKPLAYVNVGLIGKSIGTVTKEDGSFKLDLGERGVSDTIQISMIGFESQLYIVADFLEKFKDNLPIKLIPVEYNIEQIEITSKTLKEKHRGNKTESKGISGGFASNDLGSEICARIKIKKSPSYLKTFQASIASNRHEHVKFRINFYSIKDGKPFKALNHENIFASTNIQSGLLTVDLLPYNIVVEEDFFVALEWIEDLGENGLNFSMSLMGSKCFFRNASHGSWEKLPVASIGLSVFLLQ